MLGKISTALAKVARRIGWPRLIGVLLLVALLAARLWDPLPVQLIRLKIFDLYQYAKPRVADNRPVVIVDIDEPSLQKLGQWPWPRTLLAKLVDEITAKGGVAIAFDILFPEADRTSPHLIADSLPELSEAAREEIRAARNHDEVLADAMRRSRVVVAQSAYDPLQGKPRESKVTPAAFATIGADPRPYLLRYPSVLPNIEVLEEAAKGRGMVTILPDPDGLVRRVPAVLLAKDRIVPSLTTDLLRVATGQSTFLIRSDQNGVQSVVVAGAQIPTDRTGQYWVYFAPRDRDRYVSAADVIDGSIPAQKIAGKLVLVGTSATGLFDLKATPTDATMPGVEVHAQVLENILTKASLERPSYALGAEICLALLVGLAIIILAPILGALTVFLLGTALAAILAGLSWYYFSTSGLLIDVGYPLSSSFAVFLAMVFINYFREEAERRQIRSAFGQYLSPALVEQLAEDPDRLVLGGETKDMTILFSDVRGFTSISELYKKDPQGLTKLMNRFLTPLSNAIMERNGTIDKYMGDAVMAFWNAPIDDQKHAVNACDAALDMLQRLDQVNAAREDEAKQEGQPFMPLNVGIGINTGECVVGNMGSDMRFDYSVLGDSVNLAARLEGQSKSYGVPIIIGARTAAEAAHEYATIELDSIRVKGKTEPEVIHTILGRKDAIDDQAYQSLSAHVTRMREAYRNQDWDDALEVLRTCREVDNGFGLAGLYELYEARISAFRETPPPEGWDGVFTAETK